MSFERMFSHGCADTCAPPVLPFGHIVASRLLLCRNSPPVSNCRGVAAGLLSQELAAAKRHKNTGTASTWQPTEQPNIELDL